MCIITSAGVIYFTDLDHHSWGTPKLYSGKWWCDLVFCRVNFQILNFKSRQTMLLATTEFDVFSSMAHDCAICFPWCTMRLLSTVCPFFFFSLLSLCVWWFRWQFLWIFAYVLFGILVFFSKLVPKVHEVNTYFRKGASSTNSIVESHNFIWIDNFHFFCIYFIFIKRLCFFLLWMPCGIFCQTKSSRKYAVPWDFQWANWPMKSPCSVSESHGCIAMKDF